MPDVRKLQQRVVDIAENFKAYVNLIQKDKAHLTKADRRRIEALENEMSLILEPEERSDLLVDGQAIANFFGVTVRTIQLWVKNGCPKLRRGIYDLKSVFDWWMESDMAATRIENDDLQNVKLEYWREKMLRERNKRQIEEETLVPKSQIEPAWGERMAEVARGLEFLEFRLPPLVENKSQVEIREIIRTETRAIRSAYCRTGKFCENGRND